MKLSRNQEQELREELKPLLAPFTEHQGWPSLDAADTAMRVLIDMFREWGVRI